MESNGFESAISCNICHYNCRGSLKELRNHVEKFHSDKSIEDFKLSCLRSEDNLKQCKVCGRIFIKLIGLQAHFKRTHKDLPIPEEIQTKRNVNRILPSPQMSDNLIVEELRLQSDEYYLSLGGD
jgi:hypothetical protein